jgi:nucleoside-diphosphate kinase
MTIRGTRAWNQKMIETTLSIIKPDGTKRNLIGRIIGHFEEAGLEIAACKMKALSRHEAESFYAEHKGRPFFEELVGFMISAPVVIMVLRGENAIQRNRDIMGATNPKAAAEGTLRRLYSESVGENTVHGSDSKAASEREIAHFFAQTEVF